jgi:hypothetical protein
MSHLRCVKDYEVIRWIGLLMANPTIRIVLFVYVVLNMNGNVGGSTDVVCMSCLFHGTLRSYTLSRVYYLVTNLKPTANVMQLLPSDRRRCMN